MKPEIKALVESGDVAGAIARAVEIAILEASHCCWRVAEKLDAIGQHGPGTGAAQCAAAVRTLNQAKIVSGDEA